MCTTKFKLSLDNPESNIQFVAPRQSNIAEFNIILYVLNELDVGRGQVH